MMFLLNAKIILVEFLSYEINFKTIIIFHFIFLAFEMGNWNINFMNINKPKR